MVGLRTLPIIYGVDNSVMFGYGFIYIGLLGLLILNKSGNATAIALAAFAVIITTRSFLIARTAKSFDDFKLSLKWTAAAMVLGTLSIAFLY
jgi:4-hydroxybenzoate polyprenyltransferase